MKKPWLVVTVTGVAALTTLALAGSRYGGAPPSPPAPVVAQPIAFSHSTHAGQFRIDCQYCHFSAERSVAAGIPPVSSCMGCHAVIQGRNAPEEVRKLREHWQRGEAVSWVQVYKVADHVRFPHMRHVAAHAGNLDCRVCHGAVEEMEVIQKVAQPLSMGWCVSCHRDEGASDGCSVCHY